MSNLLEIHAPLSGRLVPLSEVNDEVFASGAMGIGFGIIPETDSESKRVSTPLDGKVMVIADTKHAVGIKTKEKIEVLIHVGIDTVELSGEPFNVKKQVSDSIQIGEVLMEFSPIKIIKAGKEAVTMVVFTNISEEVKSFNLLKKDSVSLGQVIGTIELN